MKKTLLFIAVALLFCFVSAQDLYDMNIISTIEITFEEADWEQILNTYFANGNNDRLEGTALINGTLFDSVGVRYKGNSSCDTTRAKNPFNIKLDYIIENQTYDGYGTLKLSNEFVDPSFVREALGFEIAAKYCPACKVNYANVYVNNQLIGLYTNVQSIDKFFVRSYYNNDENALIKGNPVIGVGAASLWYLGPDSTTYYTSYEMKSDYGWQELINLCFTLNHNTSEIENILDVDRLLWFLAFHNTLVSTDSPVMLPHNFYLYQDDNGQFNYICWDLNMAFGTFSGGQGHPPMSLTEFQTFDPFYNIGNVYFPIISRILPTPEYFKTYIAHIRTILEENFSNGWYETRALELQGIIDNSVLVDPNKFYTYNDFINNIDNSIQYGPHIVVGITELMEGRITFLNNHDAFNVTVPVISDITTSPEVIAPNSTVWITVGTTNADLLKIGYRQNEYDKFEKLEMFDDGNHNDNLAGDGIFGISLDTGYLDIQYYIYAENTYAAVLSPQRAEYEYHTLDVITETGDIVINEINYHSSDDFNTGDWIELYNPGQTALNLAGWIFRDENDSHQFILEDTIIESNGYFVLCQDSVIFSSLFPEVTNFVGDFDFGLSGGGETVRLFDADENLIDSVEYDDEGGWVTLPDGNGATLELIDPLFDNNLPESWQASQEHGTPGTVNSNGIAISDNLIN
ncbi:MAG: CotH kinase family protein, partial [Candidatus Cloacimonetes bacterium]|nr:CotH kinase family protein [Candidatus Cloacimonadota bacterium]